ncbi:putative esterase [Gordonia hirsuta DSM 44140 = NBRC 16056]|uniref:Putative esterase n=1 Tax=Gordonia hirsuta DSM 44140 = NBRC 16056 TaxID=1121927 RepID=L7L6S4_9ACTN|nr:SGNH/GDSL hydrolase family protein [Gordonia hirsuta]GAC56850.1 putative esterase [Gordonia hirsuta DSM 44140 = NBRC 16056]
MTRRRAAAAALIALLLALVNSGCTHTQAPPHRHVHLGDSYASGMGLSPVVPDSPFLCMRGQDNYGQLVARHYRWDLTDVSCAGARTGNLTDEQYFGVAPQLDALDDQVAVVTLTLGGNDADVFALATGECRRLGPTDPDGAPCAAALRSELFDRIDHQTRPALVRGLAQIAERAPRARIVITGYPWILPATTGCFDQVSIAAGDVPFLRGLQRRLNGAVRAAAGSAGARYVDLAQVSAGHDVCAGSQQRWIEPTGAGPGALHPNARGQRAMADAVQAVIDR